MKQLQSHTRVWGAPPQGVKLHTRAERMQQIAAIVKENAWAQADAASRCSVKRSCMNGILRGRASRFPPDARPNIATAIDRRAHDELEGA